MHFYITDSAGAAAAQPGYVGGKMAARPILIPRFPSHAEPRAARPDHSAGSVRVYLGAQIQVMRAVPTGRRVPLLPLVRHCACATCLLHPDVPLADGASSVRG